MTSVRKIVAAVAMSFLLTGAQLFHSIVDSILMFAGLLSGQGHYTWGNWAAGLGVAVLGEHARRHRAGHLHADTAGTAPGRRRTRGPGRELASSVTARAA